MTTRSDIIASVYEAWEKRWVGRTQPDPPYQVDGPSQYAEGIVALSAPADAQTELHQQVQEALRQAGFQVF